MMAHIARNKLGGGDGRRKIKKVKTAYLWYLPWQRKSQDEFTRTEHGRGEHHFNG